MLDIWATTCVKRFTTIPLCMDSLKGNSSHDILIFPFAQMLEENSGSDDFASSSQQTATPIQLYSKHMGGHMASQFLIPILSYRPTISSRALKKGARSQCLLFIRETQGTGQITRDLLKGSNGKPIGRLLGSLTTQYCHLSYLRPS